jgi:Flp pilus assembly protein TadD
VYLKKGDFLKAMLSFLEALEYNPTLAEANLGLGVLLAQEGKLEGALVQFNRTLELKPNLAEAHNNLASTYYLLGDYASAIAHANRVEELGHTVSTRLLEGLEPYR